MKLPTRFIDSLPGGMEDALCIRYYVEDYSPRPELRHRMLCSILGVLWAVPVLMEMHKV